MASPCRRWTLHPGVARHSVLVLPTGLTVIRFLPPLVITHEQVDQVVAAVEQVLLD